MRLFLILLGLGFILLEYSAFILLEYLDLAKNLRY